MDILSKKGEQAMESKQGEEENDKWIRDILKRRESKEEMGSVPTVSRHTPRKSSGKENISKSPRSSLRRDSQTVKLDAKKRLYEFGISVDMEDEEELKGGDDDGDDEDEDDDDIKLHFLKPMKKSGGNNVPNLDIRKSPDVGDYVGGTTSTVRQRARSKSPVFIDELNEELRKRKRLELSKANEEKDKARENTEDGDLISFFKNMFNKEDGDGDESCRSNPKQTGKDGKEENRKLSSKTKSRRSKDVVTDKTENEREKRTKKKSKSLLKADENESVPSMSTGTVQDTSRSFAKNIDAKSNTNLEHDPKVDRQIDDLFELNSSSRKSLQKQSNFSENIESEEVRDCLKDEEIDGGKRGKVVQEQKKKKRSVRSKDENENFAVDDFFHKKEKSNLSADFDTARSKSKLNVSFDESTFQSYSNSERPQSADEAGNRTSIPKKPKSHNKSLPLVRAPMTSLNATFSSPSNSSELKEMIYNQWLEKKNVQTKDEIKAKMLEQKKAAKEAEAEKNERKLVAKKTFDAWNESKVEVISKEKKKEKEVKKTEKEKVEEAMQHKRDAENFFEKWKETKDEKLKKTCHQKKKEEKVKEKETSRSKVQKSEDSLKAFESWKAEKDKVLIDKKKKKVEEKSKIGEEKLLAFEKKQEAIRAYDSWKSKKTTWKSPPSPKLTQRAWSPASSNISNAIPEKVQPVIIRKRLPSR